MAQNPFGTDQSKNIFSSTGTGNPFGSSTSGGPSLFGNPTSTPTKPLFGASTTAPSLFGAPAPSASTTPQSSPTKPPSNNTFGVTSSGSSNGLFGLPSNNPPSSSTPPTFGFAPTSVTQNQSNPPPATSSTAKPSLFGTTPAAPSGGLFGAKPVTDASTPPATTSSTPTPSLFGGNTVSSVPSTSLFGGTAPSSAPSTSLFGGTAASTAPSTSLFGGTSASSTPATTLFGSPAAPPASNPAPSTEPVVKPTEPATKSLFSAPAGGLFGAKSTAPNKSSPLATSTTFSTNTPPTSASASAPAPAPLSKLNPNASSSAPTATTTLTDNTATTATSSKPSAAPSLLRGKTMEDLVSRWTSELDERTAEFKHMADEIAAWDQVLIQNGDQISNLYGELERIEPIQSSIDQTLDYVETQQAELSAALDDYERQVAAHVPSSQDLATMPGGRARTAAQEREHAYRTAEEVHSQLHDMATSLGAMIAELNTLSGPRSTALAAEEEAAEEDPIAQVSGILNAHLSSLNWIGEISQDLGSQVHELERRVSNTRLELGLEPSLSSNDLPGSSSRLGSTALVARR